MSSHEVVKGLSSPADRDRAAAGVRPNRWWEIFFVRLRVIAHLDRRSLALFRVLVAVTTIWDICHRVRDLTAHYTDAGVMPRSLALLWFTDINWISVHMMGGSFWFAATLFAIQFMFALSLLVGYRTRLSLAVSWFLLCSLHIRNFLVLHSGDILQRVLMFFCFFLPIGDVFSVDAVLFTPAESSTSETEASPNTCGSTEESSSFPSSTSSSPAAWLGLRIPSPPAPLHEHPSVWSRLRLWLSDRESVLRTVTSPYCVASFASFALMTQFLIMYIAAYMHKTGDDWRVTYVATSFALGLDYFRRPGIPDWMFHQPELCALLTEAVVTFQHFGPALLVSPIFPGICRTIGAIGFLAMHAGFSLSFRLGQFAWISVIAPLAMLPTWFWDGLFYTLKVPRVTLYYDPQSTLSTILARSCSTFLLPLSKVLPCTQSTSSSTKHRVDHDQLLRQRPSMALLRADQEAFYGVDAFHQAWRLSICFWPLASLSAFLLRRGMSLYKTLTSRDWLPFIWPESVISAPRPVRPHLPYRLPNGRRPRPQSKLRQYAPIVVKTLALGLALTVVVLWNGGNVKASFLPQFPGELRWVAKFFHLDQLWSMFSPNPPHMQFWYIMDGTKVDGTKVELFKNGALYEFEYNEPNWGKPDPFHVAFKNHRWFKFFENGLNAHSHRDALGQRFGDWICENYNHKYHGNDRLKRSFSLTHSLAHTLSSITFLQFLCLLFLSQYFRDSCSLSPV